MNSKLRKVHIDSVEWKYAESNGNVRIYEPGTKQIKARVNFKDLPMLNLLSDEYEYVGYGGNGPGSVKQYIIDNLL